MKPHPVKIALLVTGLSLVALSSSKAQVIFNEGFEAPTVSGFETVTPTPFTYSTNNGTIDRASGLTDTEANTGSQSLEFNFAGSQYTSNGNSEYDEYYDYSTGQTLNLQAGDQLTLSFYARTDSVNTLGGGALGVFVAAFFDGGTFENQNLVFVGGGDVTDSGWTKFTSTQTLTTPITDINYTLKMATTGADATGNLYIDDFKETVTPVSTPEPATWAMLLAGCGLLATLRHFRRSGLSAKL